MKRIRFGGPEGAVRPFTPDIGASQQGPEEQVADALDHIAKSLSAIDHNLEMIAKNTSAQTSALQQIAIALNKR